MASLRGWISLGGVIAVCASAGCQKPPAPLSPKLEAEGLYLQATAEYLQGDFPKALADLEAVRERMPADPRLPAALGEVELSSGKIQDALRDFQAAAIQDPKRATTWSRIGFIQLQFGRFEAARGALQKALALQPNDFNALEGLGDLEARHGSIDRAVDDWLRSARAGPIAAAPALWMKAAEAFRDHGRAPDAIALLEKAKGARVAAPELSTLLGDLQVASGKLPEAAASYEDAAQQSKRDPSLWELVGEIEGRLDRPANAEAAYRESLKVKDRAVVHVALGRLYLRAKDRARAEQELQLALRSANGEESREGPELADLLYSLGRHKDAYLLLKEAAAEPDQSSDADLQRRTASLAKEFRDAAVVEASCKRLRASGVSGRCP